MRELSSLHNLLSRPCVLLRSSVRRARVAQLFAFVSDGRQPQGPAAELMLHADVKRCLIVAPGSLTEQWQDELDDKFSLAFDILSRNMIATSRTGNPLREHDLLIARLDQLSRNPELTAKLVDAPLWDLDGEEWGVLDARNVRAGAREAGRGAEGVGLW